MEHLSAVKMRYIFIRQFLQYFYSLYLTNFNFLTKYSSRRHFPAFSVISAILWWCPHFSSLSSPQQGTISESRLPHASLSSCSESARICSVNYEPFWKTRLYTNAEVVSIVICNSWDDLRSIEERRFLLATSASSRADDTAEEKRARKDWLASIPRLWEIQKVTWSEYS